jgi:hypothetical protein
VGARVRRRDRDDRPSQQSIDALCASGDVAAIEVKLANNPDALAFSPKLGNEGALELVRTQDVPARRALETALAKYGA